MSEIIIRAERLGKCYPFQLQRQQSKSLQQKLASSLRQLISNPRLPKPQPGDNHGPVWALRDVSFEVKQGDNLALIGHNGAGKTTLLQLLASITAPSEGWIGSRGRIGSLFSLGTGFHPQMNGRENIYLNGVALGMSIAEVKRKFDAIVDFSELEESIDMPVKFYSNGMRTRLGFSIFAHLEPEVLLIDEALSAGDMSFQRKATAKMADISKSGITTIFVSHNLNTIRQLCTTGILLQKGHLICQGPLHDVIERYEASLGKSQIATLDAQSME
jgi:lipopolysaccharide transport system ATP-binding protein